MRDDPIETTDPITTPAGTFRVRLHPDPDAMSPRDADYNIGGITISHRRIVDVDPHPGVDAVLDCVQGGDVSTRAACRYLRAALGARVVLPIHISENAAGNAYSTGDPDDTGTRPDGFTYDLPGRVEPAMGPDVTDEQIAEALRGELDLYGTWAAGEFVGYVIERLDDPTDDEDPDPDDDAAWQPVDHLGASVWGFESGEAARDSAEREFRAYTPADFPTRDLAILAVQV